MGCTTPIELSHAGTALIGQLAMPAGEGPFPAVLVMHNAAGLGQQVREVAMQLAALGYVAVATDMYGGGQEVDPWAKGAISQTVGRDPDLVRSRIRAWFETVAALPGVAADRIAAIGYCFGGSCVLELARCGLPARAVVSYHGILTTTRPMERSVFGGEVHVYSGALDPYAPHDQVEALRMEMTGAGARHAITVFGDAAHGFTDRHYDAKGRPGIAYHELADRVSWAGTVALLDLVLRA